ncbi:MAG: MGMT family protein [Kofleriaceae bacterium]|mgnify:CR=1 FL=1|jgi:alkylated DNA nucleotide flippase Atl1|nr:MGMT family protein [Kofleriaceae bacterium]MBP6838994.1 MGMT family protein [Kofleriaceae bacterium]MBP9206698.1 MGMT family protein [Kofleriaceae bacterium]
MSSAVAKRDGAPPPRVETLAVAKGASYPAGKMLISSPREIEDLVATIPTGKVLTMGALRARLATDHKADYTCPLTTGIFLRIVAEASAEERGQRRPVPTWRVVRDDGGLLDKLPGGEIGQARMLDEEGVAVLHIGSLRRVASLENVAWRPPPRRRRR